MKKKKGKREKIIFIDILKTIAIILVVLFHVLYEITLNNSLRIIGFFGVSLFFIVSGFILAKAYPNQSFSLKWFAKRFIKISSLYYLALIAIGLLFANQTYHGSLFKQLLIKFAFLDAFFPISQYSIISPAWFLIPLIVLYYLFPILNKIIKKVPYLVFIAFIIMYFIRFKSENLTEYSPLFFIGEFCFGIALAQGYTLIPLLASLLIIPLNPYTFIPFPIFYIFSKINWKFLNSIPIMPTISFIAENTLIIFLFHESFMKVILNRWHIFQLSFLPSLIILIFATLTCIFLSRRINSYFSRKLV